MARRTQQTTVAATESQASVQEEMFRSLLRTPHRQVDSTITLHKSQYDRDPNFYAHLAVHAIMREGCAVRDINEVFIATLFASEYPELREAAFVMLQALPPYQVYRVMRNVTGWKEVRSRRSFDTVATETGTTATQIGTPKKVKLSGPLRARLLKNGKINRSATEFSVIKELISHPGMGKRTVRGQLKRAIRSYLSFREHPARRDMMESGLLRAKKYFKTLYAKTHTLPCGWVNNYLFKEQVEPGSRLAALRALLATEDPAAQAELIAKNKIPCPVAISFLKNITPSVVIAMIDAMSPQELMSNIKHLARRGATNDPAVKSLIEQKLQKAKGAKKGRIDALKGAFAAEQIEGLDEDIAEILTDVTDSQLKQHGTIQNRTAVLIDKSVSMSPAIDAAKEIGAILAQACENLRVFTFDYLTTEIILKGDKTKRSTWVDGLKMVRASGGTEPETAIKKFILEGAQFDQFLLLTDEDENHKGAFAASVKQYEQKFGYTPHIVIIRLGPNSGMYSATDWLEKSCKAANIPVDVMRCESIDKIAIPNLLQLLSRKSVFELVQEVLALPLPTRADWEKRCERDLIVLKTRAEHQELLKTAPQ